MENNGQKKGYYDRSMEKIGKKLLMGCLNPYGSHIGRKWVQFEVNSLKYGGISIYVQAENRLY
jgi:hypothetical protein